MPILSSSKAMNRHFVRSAAIVCTVVTGLYGILLLIGGLYSVIGFFKSDPAAPSLWDGIVRLLYLLCIVLANKYTLRNRHIFQCLLWASVIIGTCLAYSLFFNGDWPAKESPLGWLIVLLAWVLLPLTVLLNRKWVSLTT
jgi:hypothetical protein